MASALAGLALLSVIFVAMLADVVPGDFLSEDAEPVERSDADERLVPQLSRPLPPLQPALRVINAGTVDEDPQRHAVAVAALERASSEPADTVTDDDDLSPTGTFADWYPSKVKTYRTVCVRLCDGALTPISFATTHDRLALDALRCRKSCGSPSKLYVQINPASDAVGLVDLDGKRYGELATAFKFRTSYDAACTCRPHAWQNAALARHRLNVIQSRLRRGRAVVQERLAAIRTAMSTAGAKGGRPTRPALATGSTIETGSSASLSAAPVRTGPSGPGPANRSPASIDVTEAIGGDSPVIAEIDVEIDKLAQTKSARKSSAKRRGKVAASANGERPKSDQSAFMLVFGPVSTAPGSTATGKPQPAVRLSNSMVRTEATARRFDGNDWRISNYEPL